MAPIDLIATASFGLESVVARELRALGYDDPHVADGRVAFTADESGICRTNLWLRSAERVLVKVGEFEALDFGALFEQTKALPWSDWIPPDGEFPVRGKSVRSQLASVPNCQSIVKKAIVESLKAKHNRDWFEETGPRFAVEISILRDRATLTLDTTGAGLHKRGYRTLAAPAPLRETVAAGLVQLSYWNRERPLIDPFCGSGTIPIEAALIGRNIAPGLTRSFAAESWPCVRPDLWSRARDEARDSRTGEIAGPVVGSDIDSGVLELARQHAVQAGVGDDVEFRHLPFERPRARRKYGCIICNPPYGQRSGDLEQAEEIYRAMPRVFRHLETWSVFVLTSHPQFERLFGRRADRRRKLYNGRIECTYYQYAGPRPPWQRVPRERFA